MIMRTTIPNCIYDINGLNFSLTCETCPFRNESVKSIHGESRYCKWRTVDGKCKYMANRHDLMKSLSQLTSKVFEMAKENKITPEMATHACVLMSMTDELFTKSQK